MEKFYCRGKTLPIDEYDNSLWVVGYYTCFNGVEHRIYGGYAETDCGDYYPDWVNVIPETVGRYTGLRDKNGKRIFEGDIVRLYEDVKRAFEVDDGEVIYGRGGFHIGNCNLLNSLNAIASYDWILRGEVIGNRYDNPELINRN